MESFLELIIQLNKAKYFNNVSSWHGCHNAIYYPIPPKFDEIDVTRNFSSKISFVQQGKAEFTTWGIREKIVARVAYAPEIETLFYCNVA